MIISGKNSVYEALNSDKTVNKIIVVKKAHGYEKIVSLAKDKRVRLEFADRNLMDKISPNNQGVIAYTTDFVYSDVDELFDENGKALIVILDEIEDTHNFGAIIRSAECAGATGIIIPSRRATPVNETVVKTSAGAIANVKIAKVNNINQTIDYLKDKGVWVYGLETGGKEIYSVDLTGSIALVVGSEGFGISSLTKQKCDEIVTLPLKGKVNSLNASVACGIGLYEVLRQNK